MGKSGELRSPRFFRFFCWEGVGGVCMEWGCMYCTYLEGIEPRGSYYCPDGFLYEQNRISMLLVLLLVLGATARRVVSNWHDFLNLCVSPGGLWS